MTSRLAVGLIVAFGVLCTSLGLVFLALSWTAPAPDSWGFRGFTVLFAIGFGGAGAQLAFRRPRNLVGWVMLTSGTLSAVQILVEEYAIFGIVGRTTPLPGAIYAGWLESWIWLVGVILITTFTLLIFPDGALVSPRWRIVAWLSALDGVIGVTGLAFAAGPMNNAPFADNPVALLSFDVARDLFFLSFFGLAILVTASAASLIVRFRRAQGVERQQLKWLAYEAGLIAIAVLITAVTQVVAPDWKPSQVLFILVLALMPFTIAVAVLRYRLYDIDVLINRTIVYGLTSAAIGITFFAGIVVLQSALRPLTGGSELAVAGSTLLCFGLFQPVRRSVQATVDRRFYRSRYDAGRALDTFTSRLAGEVDLDTVGAELADAVRATVQPSHVSVWVRKGPQ